MLGVMEDIDEGKTELQRAFGLRVRDLRIKSGASQERFALSIGMDRSYYAKIETGARNVALWNIAKIAHGLGMTASELLEGVDPPEGRRGEGE